jgi:hypothetical protein
VQLSPHQALGSQKMGNDRNRLQKLIEISIAKFNHFPFNSPTIEIDLEIDRGNSGDYYGFYR